MTIKYGTTTGPVSLRQSQYLCDIKDLGSLWLCYIRQKQKAGTVAFECSLYHFWTALKLHSLGRFTWFKKPDPLIQTLPSTCNRIWKDLGLWNTLKLAPTLALKSTIFLSLTENCLELYMMTIQIEILSWKNYFQWASGMVYILHFKIRPIDLYGKSGSSRWLWITCEVFFRGNTDTTM